MSSQVESLQALIKDKIEEFGILQLAKEQAQCDVDERNEEIDKLTGRIRELEQALLSSTDTSRALTQLEQELQRARKNQQDLIQVPRETNTCVHTHTHTNACANIYVKLGYM